ncbi:MAG TPA: PAS domain S-box protein, partial [Anaerolineae bacterium]
LKISQDFARNIVESSLDMIIAVDTNRHIVEFNRAAEETFGYCRDEVLGKNIDMLYADPPSGRLISQTTNAQGRLVRQVYNRRKNGQVFPSFLAASVLMDPNGHQIGLMGISRDISEIIRVEEEVEKRAKEFSALYEITRDLATQYHLPTLLQTIVERATTLLSVSGGGVYLYDPEAGDLHFEAGRGEENPPLGARLCMGQGIAGEVALSRQPLIVDEGQKFESRLPQSGASAQAAIDVPMLYGGELIGVLIVNEYQSTTRRFTQDDRRLLELFAAHAASAVHNATLFEQVRASRERLQKLSGSLLRAQEDERRGIARELHDEIGQALTSIQLNFQSIEPLHHDPGASTTLSENMAIVERVLGQVRDLSLNLRPSVLDDFGLVPALNWLVKRQPRGTGLVFKLSADEIEPRPAAEIETVCFRVAQEALTNIIRHARATHIRISLKKHEKELQLTIADDGIGFDVQKALRSSSGGSSMGLLGMYERVELVGGRIDIVSTSARGTRLNAVVPLLVRAPIVERRARRRDHS